MVSIIFFFWMLVALFALIGAMRGWAKELLVTFSMILALFLITLMENYVGVFKTMLEAIKDLKTADPATVKNVFWVRTIIVFVLAFFGYQTTAIVERFAGSGKLSRDKLQDLLLGAVIGFFNGILIVGTLLYYIHQGGYPFPEFISPPPDATKASVEQLVSFMPPRWLGIPGIYVAVGLSFLFVLIVFI